MGVRRGVGNMCGSVGKGSGVWERGVGAWGRGVCERGWDIPGQMTPQAPGEKLTPPIPWRRSMLSAPTPSSPHPGVRWR